MTWAEAWAEFWNAVQVAVSPISTLVVMTATVVLAILTRKYVLLTGNLVEETRRNRSPSVVVDIELPGRGDTRLVVRNVGGAAARNIRFRVLDSKLPLRNGRLEDLTLFSAGLSILVPGRTLKFMMPLIDERELRKGSASLTLQVTFDVPSGERVSEEVVLDLSAYKDVLFSSFRDPVTSIADAIRDSERSRQSNDRFGKMFAPRKKACSICGELVPSTAKKCSKCLEWLPTEEGGQGVPNALPQATADEPDSAEGHRAPTPSGEHSERSKDSGATELPDDRDGDDPPPLPMP